MAKAKIFTFGQLVDAMTNWENTMWSRAGYPGLAGKDVEKLLECEYVQPARERLSGEYLALFQRSEVTP